MTTSTAELPHLRSVADQRLLVRYHQTRDPRLRDEIVERFLPLARSVTLRFRGRHESMEDLHQVAALGLIKAVDRFDPRQGTAFSSYAVPTIAGELKRYFRDRTWSVRPPRDLLENTLRVDRAIERLSAELQRPPTIAEISAELGTLDEEAVLETRYASRAQHASSLDAPIDVDDEGSSLGDRIGVEDKGFSLAEDRTTITRLLRGVSERERMVLGMRFVEDRTQAEIGDALGVSQMQISRIIRRAMARLEIVAVGYDSDGSADATVVNAASLPGG
jgi:RNA polymerase sigma-B factor